MTQKMHKETECVCAATLKALGIRYLGTGALLNDRGEALRVVLLFDDTDGRAADIADQHRNGGVDVNSADLAAALSMMKDEIFSARWARDNDGRARV